MQNEVFCSELLHTMTVHMGPTAAQQCHRPCQWVLLIWKASSKLHTCNKGIKLGKKGSKLGKNGSKLGKNGSRLRPSCGFQHLLRNNVLAQLRNIKSFTFNIGTYVQSESGK